MSAVLDDLYWREDPITVAEGEILRIKQFAEVAARREAVKFERGSRATLHVGVPAPAPAPSQRPRNSLHPRLCQSPLRLAWLRMQYPLLLSQEPGAWEVPGTHNPPGPLYLIGRPSVSHLPHQRVARVLSLKYLRRKYRLIISSCETAGKVPRDEATQRANDPWFL